MTKKEARSKIATAVAKIETATESINAVGVTKKAQA